MSRTAILFILSVVFASSLTPVNASAAGDASVTVTPAVIDEKAKARDILKETLIITNTSERKLDIYPSVADINPHDGEEGFDYAQNALDRAASLANWIELSRGVIELGPGEQKEIPFIIRINLNAVPDSYHAKVSFYSGTTREDAEKSGSLADVTVNLEVQADVKEIMQLNKFFTDSVFFSGDDVLFNYQLQNIGNQDLHPKGEIRIYNRKGAEVAAVDVNKDGKTINPDQTAQLASVWNGASGFGKYKAFLNVQYGSQTATVQDTLYFWVIPWKQLLALFVGSLIAIIFFALYFHKWLEQRHFSKFMAAAGISGGAVPGMRLPTMPVPQVPLQTPTSVTAPAPAVSAPMAPVAPRKNPFAFATGLAARVGNAVKALQGAPTEPYTAPMANVSSAPNVHDVPPVAAAYSAPAEEPRAHRSLRDVLRADVVPPAPHAPGKTIDLKKMREQHNAANQPTGQGHVINLKRK